MQTFATKLKDELINSASERAELKYELVALLKFNGQLHLEDNKYSLDFQTENISISRYVFNLLNNFTEAKVTVIVRKQMKLKKNNIYIIRLMKNGLDLVLRLNLLDFEEVEKEVLQSKDRARAFLRGSFLASGSMNDPSKSRNYHLEISNANEELMHFIAKITKKYKLGGKVTKRKHQTVYYVKESEKIGDLLVFLGANHMLFEFEDIRIMRDMRNSINRVTNCEIANTQKSLVSIQRQIDEINIIEEELGLEILGEKTETIAKYRRLYDDASLVEFVELLQGHNIYLSKSGLNHQLRKIRELATKISEYKNKQNEV